MGAEAKFRLRRNECEGVEVTSAVGLVVAVGVAAFPSHICLLLVGSGNLGAVGVPNPCRPSCHRKGGHGSEITTLV